MVITNVAHSPFVSLFKNNTEDFRKELLSVRKPKPKVQPKEEESDHLDTDDVKDNFKDDIKSKEAVNETTPQDPQNPQASKDQELDDADIAEPKDPKELNDAGVIDPLSPEVGDEVKDEAETNNLETDQGIKNLNAHNLNSLAKSLIVSALPNSNPTPLEDESNPLSTKHNETVEL